MTSRPTVTGVSVPLLIVESGPQKGCSLALQTGVFSVGKSLDNDAVIADQTLSDKHFQIQKTLFGIEIKVLHGTVTLPSGQKISDNQSYSSRKNIAFSAGNTDFSLTLPKKKKIWLYGLSAPCFCYWVYSLYGICLLEHLTPSSFWLYRYPIIRNLFQTM